MSEPIFTIQLAIHRPPDLLPFAVESVLAQTLTAFELVIICDGAPSETITQAQNLAQKDSRIQVRAFPKGIRRGEEHRAEVLRTARGRYVAHIADDDLWFPDHLAVLERCLRRCDFCNTVQIPNHGSSKGNRFAAETRDLAREADRATLFSDMSNFFGPTVTGYRLEAYRRLPVGWSPAPEGKASDKHMWKKFLSEPWLRAETIPWPTAVSLPNSVRGDQTLAQRVKEGAFYAQIMRNRLSRMKLRATMLKAMSDGITLERYRGMIPRYPLAGTILLFMTMMIRAYRAARRVFMTGARVTRPPK